MLSSIGISIAVFCGYGYINWLWKRDPGHPQILELGIKFGGVPDSSVRTGASPVVLKFGGVPDLLNLGVSRIFRDPAAETGALRRARLATNRSAESATPGSRARDEQSGFPRLARA